MARIVRPSVTALRGVSLAGLPRSKSHAQRALVVTAFGGSPCRLRGAGHNDDVGACAAALRALGAHIERDGDDLEVVPAGAAAAEHLVVHAGESGTAARILGAVVAALGIRARLDGDPALRARPMGALAEALRDCGVAVEGEALPLEIDPRRADWPEELVVDAATTTQVASGFVLGALLRRRRGLGDTPHRVVARDARAVGYLELTCAVAAELGLAATLRRVGADAIVEVGSDVGPAPRVLDIPVDASAAAFPVVLAHMHGVALAVGRPRGDPHPDWDVLEDAARIAAAPPDVECVCDRVARRPDTFPALAALAATRCATTRFVGAAALRAKESDRIRAMAEGLRACGARVEELADGLVVAGPLAANRRVLAVPAPADHRVVMALALLGTVLPAGLRIERDEAVGKSWPGFWRWLAAHASVDDSP